jgi:hypothetical protein
MGQPSLNHEISSRSRRGLRRGRLLFEASTPSLELSTASRRYRDCLWVRHRGLLFAIAPMGPQAVILRERSERRTPWRAGRSPAVVGSVLASGGGPAFGRLRRGGSSQAARAGRDLPHPPLRAAPSTAALNTTAAASASVLGRTTIAAAQEPASEHMARQKVRIDRRSVAQAASATRKA